MKKEIFIEKSNKIFKNFYNYSLIEYDGIQHYKPTFGEKSFVLTKNNDKIKTKYCLDNGIKLIRIPYWEKENIEEILQKELING